MKLALVCPVTTAPLTVMLVSKPGVSSRSYVPSEPPLLNTEIT